MPLNLRHRSFVKELDFTTGELEFLDPAVSRPQAGEVRRVRGPSIDRQEHRADLREDVHPHALRVRGRRV